MHVHKMRNFILLLSLRKKSDGMYVHAEGHSTSLKEIGDSWNIVRKKKEKTYWGQISKCQNSRELSLLSHIHSFLKLFFMHISSCVVSIRFVFACGCAIFFFLKSSFCHYSLPVSLSRYSAAYYTRMSVYIYSVHSDKPLIVTWYAWASLLFHGTEISSVFNCSAIFFFFFS